MALFVSWLWYLPYHSYHNGTSSITVTNDTYSVLVIIMVLTHHNGTFYHSIYDTFYLLYVNDHMTLNSNLVIMWYLLIIWYLLYLRLVLNISIASWVLEVLEDSRRRGRWALVQFIGIIRVDSVFEWLSGCHYTCDNAAPTSRYSVDSFLTISYKNSRPSSWEWNY